MQPRVRLFTIVGFSLVFVTACSGFLATPIKKIQANPRDYADKQVTISGTVVDSFSLVFIKYFMIDDGTGRMIVITQKPMPAKGEKIRVQGTIRDAFSLGDQQLLVLIERDDDVKASGTQ